MRKKRVKLKPMPTEEEKRKAQLKSAGADPLVWAMKKVDEKFPDEREKDEKTLLAEAAVEEAMDSVEEMADDTEETAEAEYDFDDEMLTEDDINENTSEGGINENASENGKPIHKIIGGKSAQNTLKDKKVPRKALDTSSLPGDKKIEGLLKDGDTIQIRAEGKVTMPVDDGVVTMEVKPMRQDVSNVQPSEKPKEAPQTEDASKGKVKVKKIERKKKTSENAKTQVKLTSLESKQKNMMIALAVLIVVAVGGVGFGIAAMVRQGRVAEELESQIVASSNVVSNENGKVDEDYIYLRDWGLKIKIVAGLTDVSYNFQTGDYTEVLIWGAKRDNEVNYTPDFARQSKNNNPLGTVVRVPRYERAAAGRLIWYDDYYNYYYQGPSGDPTVNESEMSWWVESYLLIKDMLTNADNYTSINDNSEISQS